MADTYSGRGGKIAFSVAETVEATGLGKTTVYALLREGKLRSVKVGNRRLVRASDVVGLVEG